MEEVLIIILSIAVLTFGVFTVVFCGKCDKLTKDLALEHLRLSLLQDDYKSLEDLNNRTSSQFRKLLDNIDDFINEFNSWHDRKIKCYHDGNEWVIYYDA